MAKAQANLGALNNEVVFPMRGNRDPKISVASGLTGTVSFEVARDGGSTYEACPAAKASDGSVATSHAMAAAAGTFYPLSVGPNDTVRARVSAYTSGAALGTIEERA